MACPDRERPTSCVVFEREQALVVRGEGVAGEGVRELIEDLTGDDLHQRERAAELLTEQLDSPMTIDLRVRWLVARRDWCALRDLGAEAVPPLLEVLARSCARTSLREANYQRSGRSADAWRNQILDEMVVRTLAGLGDPGAEEGVIGFLFERNGAPSSRRTEILEDGEMSSLRPGVPSGLASARARRSWRVGWRR